MPTITTKENRFYNPTLANELEGALNVPYNHEEGPHCSACDNKDAKKYVLTGYVIDDGSGVYVEKRCACGAITTDGDGEFHSHYEIDGNNVWKFE